MINIDYGQMNMMARSCPHDQYPIAFPRSTKKEGKQGILKAKEQKSYLL